MEIDHKIFYAIILVLLLNECKIAGCVTNREDPDQTPRFCPPPPPPPPLPHTHTHTPLESRSLVYLWHTRFSIIIYMRELLVYRTLIDLHYLLAQLLGPRLPSQRQFHRFALPSVRYTSGQTGLSKSVDPDETAECGVSSASNLFSTSPAIF